MLQSPNTSEKNIGKAIPRPDLKLIKSCNCDKCVFENVWIQLQIDTQTFIIGDLYRHPNGNASHFTQDLELSLNKIDINMRKKAHLIILQLFRHICFYRMYLHLHASQ